MKIDIKELTNKYFCKNLPVLYNCKHGKVTIYPILVEEWDLFEENYDILIKEKNKIPMPEIIQMSYLEFVVRVLEEKDSVKLAKILTLCLHEYNSKFNLRLLDDKICIVITDENGMIKSIINAKDFDNIKKIILYQNIEGYDDTEISEDIKKVMQDYWKLKNGSYEPVTLEDKLIFLGNEINLTTDNMLKMTYREFDKRFSMAVEKMDYTINKTAELSGNVKFDKPIEHIIYKKKKNKLEQFFVDKDTLQNKIDSINS